MLIYSAGQELISHNSPDPLALLNRQPHSPSLIIRRNQKAANQCHYKVLPQAPASERSKAVGYLSDARIADKGHVFGPIVIASGIIPMIGVLLVLLLVRNTRATREGLVRPI